MGKEEERKNGEKESHFSLWKEKKFSLIKK